MNDNLFILNEFVFFNSYNLRLLIIIRLIKLEAQAEL